MVIGLQKIINTNGNRYDKVSEDCFEGKATSKYEGTPAMARGWKIISNRQYGFVDLLDPKIVIV